MKIPHLLFALLILMAISIGALLSIEEVPAGHGFDHRAYPTRTIQQAPDGLRRHGSVIWAASFFGATVALFTVAAMALGVRNEPAQGIGKHVLVVAGMGYAMLLVMIVVLYWSYIDDPALGFLGFPISTGWMLLVFGPSPVVLVFIYVAMFPRWILTTEDMERFHELVAARRERRAN